MRIGFAMPCRAVYNTSIEVPDELANKWFDNLNNKDIQTEILAYVKEKAGHAPMTALEFIEDLPDEIGGEIEIYDKTFPKNKSKTFYANHT